MNLQLLFLLLIAAIQFPAFACSCRGSFNIESSVEGAEYLVYGRVLDTSHVRIAETVDPEHRNTVEQLDKKWTEYPYILQVKFLLYENYKGEHVSDTLTIFTPRLSSACGYRLIPGEEYVIYGEDRSFTLIFFGLEGTEKKGSIWTSSCSRSTDNVETEIAEIKMYYASIAPTDVEINLTDTLFVDYNATFAFKDFECEIYEGELAAPSFEDNPYADDPEYVQFIEIGCAENGINFAGKYTVIPRGCGALCSHIFIVNRENGTIFSGAFEPNDSGRYGYSYQAKSQLLIANSEIFLDSTHTKLVRFPPETIPEYYVFSKGKFKRIE